MIRMLKRWLRSWIGGRSGGVRVSGTVLRAIRRGDAARRTAAWGVAAAEYRTALRNRPDLAHIWVQLGHAFKEAGESSEAEQAYRQAAEVNLIDPEPMLRLGHLLMEIGETAAAAQAFVAALHRSPGHLGASVELVRLLPDQAGADPAWWNEALHCLGLDPAAVHDVKAVLSAGALLFDITDLFGYFGHARLPTGIQRVQIETVLAGTTHADIEVHVCVHVRARGGWVLLPPEQVAALCRASLVSDVRDDPDWLGQVRALNAHIAISAATRFPHGCVLVSLGTSWSEPGYLADVSAERAASHLVFIALIHDLIPVVRPDWFVPSLGHAFAEHLTTLIGTADGFLAISNATRADLIRFGKVDPESVAVVRIDGDFRPPVKAADQQAVLAAYHLEPHRFVLMVSTVEPRKNHVGAFRAWLRLAALLGEERLPQLVCVGGSGWLNEPIHALLAREPLLQRRVTLLSGVSDQALAILYRCCSFTLYPSFYEGWGLPVTESLSYGKVAAVSRTSSIPEAGGEFAVYFDPDDSCAIAEAIQPLITDSKFRERCEARIAAGYSGRDWAAITREIMMQASAIAARRSA